MTRVFGCLIYSYLALHAIGDSRVCFAEPLTEEQQTRAAQLRAVSARASGHWENPNYPTAVTLKVGAPRQKDLEVLRKGATGSYAERRKSGEPFGQGTWRFDEQGSGSLTWPATGGQPGGSSRATLVANDILALQPFTRTGGLYGDGLVMFRAKYDFEGLKTRAIPSTDAHQNRIQGRWTHINLDKVHEVTREGLWLERRKKGGIHSQGMWQIHDDGTYTVKLDNNWRIRAWPAGHDKVVLVWFDPEGALDGDGAILSRE